MPQHQSLNELSARFFRTFARAEYALKAAGFNNGDGPAEANWSEFARAIEAFVANPPNSEVGEAIQYILAEPPRKQFIINKRMEWRAIKPNTDSQADALFQYIRRIRNNLFHGGKFNGHWFEPERSERLLGAALAIIIAAVEVHQAVQAAYHG